jgi:hypothetical protein
MARPFAALRAHFFTGLIALCSFGGMNLSGGFRKRSEVIHRSVEAESPDRVLGDMLMNPS